MCVNYEPVRPRELERFGARLGDDVDWKPETWKDYLAPIITRGADDGDRQALLASYAMVPRRRIPKDVRVFDTMNARSESVGTKHSYSKAWRQCDLCLVPMHRFFEPNWETGKHERWAIGMADGEPFAVAGLWRSWDEPDGGLSYSFTQLTVNADAHPLMRRFHRPDDEKRSLVIVPATEYDDWLGCTSPELARAFMQLYPAEMMHASAAPKARSSK